MSAERNTWGPQGRPSPGDRAGPVMRRGLLAAAAALLAGALARATEREAQATHDGTLNLHVGRFDNAAAAGAQTGLGTSVDGLEAGLWVSNTGSGTAIRGTCSAGIGVRGTSTTTGDGVSGASNTGEGVRGASDSGAGVSGTSNSWAGVIGTSPNSGVGVYGSVQDGWGVWGESDSNQGVYGESNRNNGVRGVSRAAAGTIVSGHLAAGVYGTGSSNVGVYGATTGAAVPSYGVVGQSSAAFGMFGQSNAPAGTLVPSPTGLPANVLIAVAGVQGVSSGNPGLYGISSSSFGVVGQSVTGTGVYGSGGALAGDFVGNVRISGNLDLGGMVLRPLARADGSTRALYGVESTGSWVEDFGRGRLRNGRADVQLDRDFATMVLGDDYHVFLTAYADSEGLYVTNQTASGFEVRERRGGQSSHPFSYRVVAQRPHSPAAQPPRRRL